MQVHIQRREGGVEKHNGEKNMRRTEVGGTAGKLLHKLQNWLSLSRYYAGYNEGCSIKSVDQGTVRYTDIKRGRSFDGQRSYEACRNGESW
jgi:hypothetical protein